MSVEAGQTAEVPATQAALKWGNSLNGVIH
jgi:hypothetical protein